MQKPHGYLLRKGRRSEPRRVYLVTSVTLARRPLFEDFRLARIVIGSMRYLHSAGHVNSLCFVVMPDHLHWLFELGDDWSLANVVNRLKTWTARRINDELGEHGPIWQQGFHDRAVRANEDVRSIARYVIANPLRAGLVDDIRKYALWDAVWIDEGQVL